jgi:hypothetical protein
MSVRNIQEQAEAFLAQAQATASAARARAQEARAQIAETQQERAARLDQAAQEQQDVFEAARVATHLVNDGAAAYISENDATQAALAEELMQLDPDNVPPTSAQLSAPAPSNAAPPAEPAPPAPPAEPAAAAPAAPAPAEAPPANPATAPQPPVVPVQGPVVVAPRRSRRHAFREQLALATNVRAYSRVQGVFAAIGVLIGFLVAHATVSSLFGDFHDSVTRIIFEVLWYVVIITLGFLSFGWVGYYVSDWFDSED